MDVTRTQGVACFKVTLNSHSNILILILSVSVSRQFLQNGLTDSIQIWHLVVTGIQGVSYSKVTINSHV